MRFALTLPPGVVSDQTDFEATGRWTEANNVRFVPDPKSIGGWAKAFATPVTGTCRNALAWTERSALTNVAFGTHSKLMVLKDGALADITPALLSEGNIDQTEIGYGGGGYGVGGYGGGALVENYPRTWSLATWGEWLMASPRNWPLYIWQLDTASVATEITQAPDHIASMLVNSFRQVMAFGCEQVDGTYNPMCIRGCDFGDYTTWTPTTSNNAFEETDLEGGSRLVRGLMMGPYCIVWSDTSLFQGYYTGNALKPWRFDPVADNCGLAGPNAVTIVNQTAFWLTPDLQFYAFKVGSPPQPLPCPISQDFKDNIDTVQINKVACTSISEFGEIWFHYPDARDGDENSRYLSVKSANPGVWSKGVMARTAAIDSGPRRYPLMVSPEGYIYDHETGFDADGADLEWQIRSSDLYFDNAQEEVDVDGIWPDFEDQQGTAYLKVYTKKFPQATEKPKGPWALAPGREKKDFFFNAKMASVEFYGAGAPSAVRIGKPTFGVQ